MAMKWFRKHNKKILVVGVALLMLAFLMPGRQQGCGGGGFKDEARAWAFGKKVMLSELVRAEIEMRLLAEIGLQLPAIEPIDYLLLAREARQMHIPAASEALPEGLVAQVVRANEVGSLGELAQKLARRQEQLRFRIDEKLLRTTLGTYWSVVQAERLVLGGPRTVQDEEGRRGYDYSMSLGMAQPSEQQLLARFRDVREKLGVEYVALPAWLYGSKVKAASESEIIEHFVTYRDKYPGTPDNDFGLGYKQQALVKLEYIKIDVDETTKSEVEEPQSRDLREYYDQNKELYLLPAEKTGEGSEGAADETGAGPEAEVEPIKRYKPFEEVYEDVERRWLEKRAREKILEMMARARSLSSEHWKKVLEEQGGGAVDPTELYPYFSEEGENLVSRLNEEFGVKPQHFQTDWIDAGRADSLPGIGTSYTTAPPATGFLGLLAFIIRQQGAVEESDEASEESLQIGQDSPLTLIDAQGNAYLFRLTGLRREEVLSSEEMLANEDLRARVAADVAALRAYELAREQGRKLLALAEQKGLAEALAELGQKDLETRQAGMVARADASRRLVEVALPLVDSQGRIQGEAALMWQSLGHIPELRRAVGVLRIRVDNKSQKGRITAVGMNIPLHVRINSPQVASSEGAARNGGEAVATGQEGYSLRYFGRGIDGGAEGKFDLLISADGQELTSKANLDKGGIETGDSAIFILQLSHGRWPVTAVSFASAVSVWPVGATGMGAPVVARLESSGKSELLRGVFPANRQSEFLDDCFTVLSRPSLVSTRVPAEEATGSEGVGESEAEGEEPKEENRPTDLLTEGLGKQPPCTLVMLPRQRLCYVASVDKHQPLLADEFRQSRGALLNSLMAEEYRQLQSRWWNSASIRQRAGLQPIKASEEGQTSEEEQQAADDPV